MAGPTPKPYFLFPFCVDGVDGTDTLTINNTGANPGTVSYEFGFTSSYELPSTNPSNLPVPRQQFNQLMFDVTSALQQLQNYGVPNWVASGSGGPANYPKNAFVLYSDGNVYVSAVSSNTSVPGVDNNWILFNPSPNPVQTGMIFDFAGITIPATYAACDGTAYSRTVFPAAFAALTFTQTCTLTSSNNVITVTDSSNMYGPTIDSLGALQAGMAVEGTGIAPNTRIASISGTSVTLTNSASVSGSEVLRFFLWGNGDGSTTFNVPNLNGKVTMGSKGGVITGTNGIGQNVGQIGGRNSYTMVASDMAQHTHDLDINATDKGSITNPPAIQKTVLNPSLLYPIANPTNGITGYSSQTAMPTLQASAIVQKIIKM